MMMMKIRWKLVSIFFYFIILIVLYSLWWEKRGRDFRMSIVPIVFIVLWFFERSRYRIKAWSLSLSLCVYCVFVLEALNDEISYGQSYFQCRTMCNDLVIRYWILYVHSISKTWAWAWQYHYQHLNRYS